MSYLSGGIALSICSRPGALVIDRLDTPLQQKQMISLTSSRPSRSEVFLITASGVRVVVPTCSIRLMPERFPW